VSEAIPNRPSDQLKREVAGWSATVLIGTLVSAESTGWWRLAAGGLVIISVLMINLRVRQVLKTAETALQTSRAPGHSDPG